MPPKSKLDKFFAKKDKKKVGDKPDGAKQVDDDDEVMKKEAAVDFGIGGDFNTQARVIKLKKEEGSKETTVMYVPSPSPRSSLSRPYLIRNLTSAMKALSPQGSPSSW